jgi:hypothetical protein
VLLLVVVLVRVVRVLLMLGGGFSVVACVAIDCAPSSSVLSFVVRYCSPILAAVCCGWL